MWWWNLGFKSCLKDLNYSWDWSVLENIAYQRSTLILNAWTPFDSRNGHGHKIKLSYIEWLSYSAPAHLITFTCLDGFPCSWASHSLSDIMKYHNLTVMWSHLPWVTDSNRQRVPLTQLHQMRYKRLCKLVYIKCDKRALLEGWQIFNPSRSAMEEEFPQMQPRLLDLRDWESDKIPEVN